MCAARKAAARLLSPRASTHPFSAALLLRGRAARGGSLEARLATVPHERASVLRFWVRRRRFHDARGVFDERPTRTAPVWTLTISGCARRGRYADGMRAFAEMLAEGEATPNAFVLAAVVRCCAGMGDVESGKRVHGWMLRNGVHLDVVLCNAVLDMYAKCGQFERARRVFGAMAERDAVSWNIAIGACIQSGDILGSMQLFDESPLRDTTSWNTIISGLMRSGHAADALSHLRRMAQAGVVFNHYTYSTAFVLAGMLLLPDLGRQLHGRVLIAALEGDAFVRSSLMDMYCKCGLLEAAASVFDHWSPLTRDMNFAWSTMVAGYVQNGREEEALDLFRRMLREGVAADRFTLTSVAAACANVGMVEQGRQVHGCVEKLWYKLDAPLASAIVDMYAKCGNLEDARSIFDRACTKNIAVWTSMLCSYASHGQGRIAIELFERMTAEKMTPNEITLVGVLSACSHVGLVSEGELYFKQMQEEYGIVPSIEHYNCIVDLYGRSGLLDKAKNFIEENNINHEAIVWKTLLSACRLHQHNEYAKLASEKLVQLEQCDAGSYVMLSNIYATNNKWHDTFELRVSMQERKVRKQPGRSWIHLKNTVHTFVAGDASHPQSAEIYAYLEKLVERLKEIGYTSRTDLVVHDVEDEQRETALKFHSEKLAIAFGIISTPSGTPLRIFKNLRVCEDCHEAIKYISLATGRCWVNPDKEVLAILQTELKSKQDKSFLTFIDKCIEVCKESREGSHLNPSSGLFQPNEKKDVMLKLYAVPYMILSCGWILSHTCTIMAMKKLPWHHGRVNNIINVVGLLFVNDARMATRVLFPFLQAECLDLWAKILNWVIQVQAIVGKNVGISDDPL
uniref:DYW domain-containing protein n=1 Tax=Oryza rufipogon TaxID=4529 RepID=A0A0E0Q613_ORYRU